MKHSFEPYRLWFPFGAMLGVAGVMLWPAFVYGWIPVYPGLMHARIMVQGFIFSFMAGFLTSAMPHMLEVPPISKPLTCLLMCMVMGMVILHVTANSALGDCIFATAVAVLLVSALTRWGQRSDMPPPGLLLAFLGLVGGAVGSLLASLSLWAGWRFEYYALGQLLLYQGMTILPVLGAGVYLLPRMLGLPNRHLFQPASKHPSWAWRRRARFMLLCGGVVLITFPLQVWGHVRLAYVMRVAAILICLITEVPFYRVRAVPGTIPKGIAVAFSSIVLGYVLLTLWPERAVSYLHVSFISGFGLLILMIGARVMLGHSGRAGDIYGKSNTARWVIGLVMTVTATRISADLIPSMQLSHYAYAGLFWSVAVIIWLAVLGPLVQEFPRGES